MPRASLKKIKSAPKLVIGAGIAAAAVCLLVVYVVLQQPDGGMYRQLRVPDSDKTYALEVVSTPEAQAQGLSGRSGLADGKGMLFVNNTEAERCFWMKDMQFSIDMIWVSAGNRIVQIEGNVAPDTFPQEFCARAQYVIELPAGAAGRSGLNVGDQLQF